MNVRRNDSVIF